MDSKQKFVYQGRDVSAFDWLADYEMFSRSRELYANSRTARAQREIELFSGGAGDTGTRDGREEIIPHNPPVMLRCSKLFPVTARMSSRSGWQNRQKNEHIIRISLHFL